MNLPILFVLFVGGIIRAQGILVMSIQMLHSKQKLEIDWTLDTLNPISEDHQSLTGSDIVHQKQVDGSKTLYEVIYFGMVHSPKMGIFKSSE